jgi:5-methylcytosine-specific restriction endonuclease McrA
MPGVKISDLRPLWLRQKGRCALTGVSLEGLMPSLDHIIPRLHGGTNGISNLRFVHPKANYAKHSGTDEEFWSWIDAVIAEREKIF